MTEVEWLACCDPDAMFSFTADRVDSQLLELFGCACCRRIFDLLADQRSRRAEEVRELLAQGKATEAECSEAIRLAAYARRDARAPLRLAANVDELSPDLTPALAAGAAFNASRGLYRVAANFATRAVACGTPSDWQAAFAAERKAQCQLIREFIGGQVWTGRT